MATMKGRSGRKEAFEYTATVADSATSDAVLIPTVSRPDAKATVVLAAAANTASIEFTASTEAAVAADTAVWQTWPFGVVTGTVSAVLNGTVTALRCVSASGEVNFDIII